MLLFFMPALTLFNIPAYVQCKHFSNWKLFTFLITIINLSFIFTILLSLFPCEAVGKNLPDSQWISFSEESIKNLKSSSEKMPRVTVVESTKDQVIFKVTIPGMSTALHEKNKEKFRIIRLGQYSGELPPGQPNLPCIRKHVHVPRGKSVDLQVTFPRPAISYEGYYLFPIQPPQPYHAKVIGFQINKDVYSQDNWLPEQMAHCGPLEIMRGQTLCLVSI